MRIEVDTDTPFLIDGETKIVITFETGDIFIDISHQVRAIANIENDKIIFTDETFENLPLSDEFLQQYRYAGTVEDFFIRQYTEAVPLI